MSEKDLQLSDISMFTGTEKYHRIPPFNTVVTDGVAYVIRSGFSWFVTDMLAVIETKKWDDLFLVVKLIRNATGGAQARIEDGNGKTYYVQEYTVTDAEANPILYWVDGVLMVQSEY